MSGMIKGNISGKQTLRGKIKELYSLDNTLTKEGFAADAKAVGDALKAKASSDHKHTASEVGARPNTWMPTASDVGAAPAGYGLGNKDNTPIIDNWGTLNAVVQPGWYKVAFDTWFVGEAIMRVDAMGNQIVQTFMQFDGVFTIGRRAKAVNSDWAEFEWENPTMIPGVEYRTTERYNDKPVYAKLVDYNFTESIGGTGLTDIGIPHYIPDFGSFVRCSAKFSTLPLPQTDLINGNLATSNVRIVNDTNIILRLINDEYTRGTFEFTIYYTKE